MSGEGYITRVKFSDWAAPIVLVEKRDSSIRVYGYYCVAKTEVYAIPKINEMFSSLAGGKKFSKLDLSHAYQQIELKESQKYVTVNTHKGALPVRLRGFLLVLLQRPLCSSEPWNPCCSMELNLYQKYNYRCKPHLVCNTAYTFHHLYSAFLLFVVHIPLPMPPGLS